ncbi:PIR protein [Plasmodium vivax]|uniref:VIR protein n=1 Tax=Plasmodium vivax TaxID=5855 RepID=A0A564ZNS5_PLAVI|nr:PIR protein [Plasmodium vivax]
MIVINEYIKHSNESESDNSQLDTGDDCNSFSEMYANGNNTVWKNICEQFIKLCKQLPRVKNNNEFDPNFIKDWNFLSYWLNIKLRENQLNGITCPNSFYSGMENHCFYTLFPFLNSPNLIYNINEEHLSRMELLYILHENYSKLNTILNINTSAEPKTLLEPSSECSNYYESARYKFIGSAVGIIPLLGILYKFTPIGQMFKSPQSKLPKGHSNNIDEIMKTSLLNYENEQLNFNQEKYNIEYHPARIR